MSVNATIFAKRIEGQSNLNLQCLVSRDRAIVHLVVCIVSIAAALVLDESKSVHVSEKSKILYPLFV